MSYIQCKISLKTRLNLNDSLTFVIPTGTGRDLFDYLKDWQEKTLADDWNKGHIYISIDFESLTDEQVEIAQLKAKFNSDIYEPLNVVDPSESTYTIPTGKVSCRTVTVSPTANKNYVKKVIKPLNDKLMDIIDSLNSFYRRNTGYNTGI